jgi:hypothetical protein
MSSTPSFSPPALLPCARPFSTPLAPMVSPTCPSLHIAISDARAGRGQCALLLLDVPQAPIHAILQDGRRSTTSRYGIRLHCARFSASRADARARRGPLQGILAPAGYAYKWPRACSHAVHSVGHRIRLCRTPPRALNAPSAPTMALTANARLRKRKVSRASTQPRLAYTLSWTLTCAPSMLR